MERQEIITHLETLRDLIESSFSKRYSLELDNFPKGNKDEAGLGLMVYNSYSKLPVAAILISDNPSEKYPNLFWNTGDKELNSVIKTYLNKNKINVQ